MALKRIFLIAWDTCADALRLSLAAIKPGRAPEPVKERLKDMGDGFGLTSEDIRRIRQ